MLMPCAVCSSLNILVFFFFFNSIADILYISFNSWFALQSYQDSEAFKRTDFDTKMFIEL